MSRRAAQVPRLNDGCIGLYRECFEAGYCPPVCEQDPSSLLRFLLRSLQARQRLIQLIHLQIAHPLFADQFFQH